MYCIRWSCGGMALESYLDANQKALNVTYFYLKCKKMENGALNYIQFHLSTYILNAFFNKIRYNFNVKTKLVH